MREDGMVSSEEIFAGIKDPELAKSARRILRLVEANEKEASVESEPEPERPNDGIPFPQWTNGRRAAPCAVFRSALFPALKRQKRRFLKEQQIAAVDGVKVFFTGEQFDQSDLDVYLELLHIMKEQPSGTECTFSAYSLLKALGRSIGKANRKWLHSVIIRLRSGTVDMTDHNKRYFGGLIEGGVKDEITKHYTLSLNSKFAALFRAAWASLEHEQRRRLGQNPTAKALHAYYSTHAAPGPHRFDTLAAIAGLTDKNPRKVKMKIKAAHDLLASEGIGFLSGYEINSNTIQAYINQTGGQLAHIARKCAGSINSRKKLMKS